MPIRYTLWDEDNRGHILEDGNDHPERELLEEDVDDVVLQRVHPHVVLGQYRMKDERRVDVVGKTKFDRVLFVVYAPQPVDAARPVSARDATQPETDILEGRRK